MLLLRVAFAVSLVPVAENPPGTGWVAISEANLDHSAGLYPRGVKQLHRLKAELSTYVDLPGVAVDTRTPIKSPWRVLTIHMISGGGNAIWIQSVQP